jgi:hypothetical protein
VTAAQRSRQIHLTTRVTSCRPSLSESGIFDVIVGTGLNFGVNRSIMTKRSDFFRTARSERWTSASNTKPTELPEQDLSIFDLYLDCLYNDVMPEVPLLALPSVTLGVTNINVIREKRPSVGATNETLINAHWKKLIRLYTLADHLLDPKTTNTTIDEMRRFYHKIHNFSLDTELIDLILQSTRDEDCLRNLFADFYPLEGRYTDHNLAKEWFVLLFERTQALRVSGYLVVTKGTLARSRGVISSEEWGEPDYYQHVDED